MMEEIHILYRNEDITAVVKPPGIPVEKDKTGDKCLLDILAAKTGRKHWLVHRLDRPVGGVIVLADTAEKAAQLSRLFQERKVKKEYLTVVCGEVTEKGKLSGYLKKNQRLNMSKMVSKGTAGSKEAVLRYTPMGTIKVEDAILTLLSVELETGRHHQIRVQLAHAGWPVWGDVKYNLKAIGETRGQTGFVPLALWSSRLVVPGGREGDNSFNFYCFPEDQYPFSLF